MIQIELTEEEAILAREALLNEKHALKQSPSERGQRLSQLAGALAAQLDNKVNKRRY